MPLKNSSSVAGRPLIRTTRVPLRMIFATNSDRKSTRLNSSHLVISYAVFCLKKKNKAHSTLTLLLVHPADHLTTDPAPAISAWLGSQDSLYRRPHPHAPRLDLLRTLLADVCR